MLLNEDIRSVTDMKLHPAALLEAVARTRRPVVITQNGRARAVVQDVASFERTRKAILLLKLAAQGEADVRRGRVSKQGDVFHRVEKRISGRA